ncbi:carbohydrate ABC transporter permease [Dictyobacter formicarum]|uniref:Sugar ABC transporter permease n=1 Tax=Dictyobacter formicarum TaxID=2778368 RepID=A0ABQ3VMN2_9CHLR|nr:sugar ABC transporter permease [Dictyobacter formicarum]GHO87097.1 sugar ABC transporter permease [Dictyobacter formicarum]
MAVTDAVLTTNVTKATKAWWQRYQRRMAPYIFIAPFFIIFLIFGVYPIVYSFILSFFKGFGFDNKTFFGLGNYMLLFQDPRYYSAVLNTSEYVLGNVLILAPLALLLAVALNSAFVRWKGLYKTALFFPIITSSVIISVIFARVFDMKYGLLNALLSWFHIGAVGWLSNKPIVMPSFILIGIWTNLGITMLFWLAGLNGIDQQIYEAASIDGAGRWQSFFQMTLPLLRPVTLFVVIQMIISSYNLFAEPLLLTNGGPSDASLTITLYLYNQGFESLNVGYASAIAYTMTALLLILSILNIKFFGGFGTAADS